MSKSIRLRDHAIISFGGEFREYLVRRVASEGIYVSPLTVDQFYLLIQSGGEWKVQGFDLHHSITFKSHRSGLTSVKEMDEEIMLRLPYSEIIALGSTSKKFNELVSSEFFWKRKVQLDFGPVTEYRFPGETSKQQYLRIIKRIRTLQSKKNISSYQGELMKILSSGRVPNIFDVERAIYDGDLEALKLLEEKNLLYLVSTMNDDLASNAVFKARIETLDWLAARGILPSHPEVIEVAPASIIIWLVEHGIYPLSDYVATNLLRAANQDELNYMENLGLTFSPEHFNSAVIHQNLLAMNWLARRKILPLSPVYVGSNNPEVLGWLLLHKVPLSQSAVDRQPSLWVERYPEMLELLEKENYKFTCGAADVAILDDNLAALLWLANRGMSPKSVSGKFFSYTDPEADEVSKLVSSYGIDIDLALVHDVHEVPGFYTLNLGKLFSLVQE